MSIPWGGAVNNCNGKTTKINVESKIIRVVEFDSDTQRAGLVVVEPLVREFVKWLLNYVCVYVDQVRIK